MELSPRYSSSQETHDKVLAGSMPTARARRLERIAARQAGHPGGGLGPVRAGRQGRGFGWADTE